MNSIIIELFAVKRRAAAPAPPAAALRGLPSGGRFTDNRAKQEASPP